MNYIKPKNGKTLNGTGAVQRQVENVMENGEYIPQRNEKGWPTTIKAKTMRKQKATTGTAMQQISTLLKPMKPSSEIPQSLLKMWIQMRRLAMMMITLHIPDVGFKYSKY